MLTPAQIAEPGTESSHQKAIFQWAALNKHLWPQLDCLFAVPNGGNYAGNQAAGARMKAEGLKSGVPDMFWPYQVNGFGLWIELKRPGAHTKKDGDRGPNQVKWHLKLRALGYPVVTAYGWEAAVWALIAHATGALAMDGSDCLFVWDKTLA